MEVIVRIRRTILAPAILAIGTTGALVAGPVLALTTAAAPAGYAVAVTIHPDMSVYGG
jgi:lysozyme family protein